MLLARWSRWGTFVALSGLVAAICAVVNGSEANARRARAPDVPAGTERANPCSAIGERLSAEYEAFLSSRRECRRASDCDLALAQCPLPIYRAVAGAAKREVDAFAEQLVLRAKDEGCVCASDMGEPKVACIKRQCSEVRRY